MRKGSGKAKITDKQRLDFMLKNPGRVVRWGKVWQFLDEDGRVQSRHSTRLAIDAAIRASKPRPARGKAERGK